MRSSPLALSRAALLIMAVTVPLAACGDGGSGGTTQPPVNGTVSGQVTASGTGVPGATLTLSQAGASSRTATSAATGAYSFSAVPAGSWSVGIAAPSGFALAGGQAANVPITVTAGQTTTTNFTLVSTGAQVVEVELIGSAFSPSNVTIAVGTTVRWIYRSGGPHTVTPDGHTTWSSATLTTPSQTFEHTFTAAGTYAYYCDPHRSIGMTGVVTVQ